MLDVVLILPLAYAGFKGFSKGFIYEVFSLLALGLGIYGCMEFSGYATQELSAHVDPDSSWLPLLSYTLTFIVIVIIVSLAGKLLTKAVGIVQLGLVNKLFGILFGVLKAAFFLSAVLLVFNAFNDALNLLQEDTMKKSLLFEPLSQFLLVVIPGNESNPVYQTFLENFKSLFHQ
ncbi:MAG: CvpA family protein [Luteibaculum sp.]